MAQHTPLVILRRRNEKDKTTMSSDESGSRPTESADAAVSGKPLSSPVALPSSSAMDQESSSKWQLPVGIEAHLETGLLKAAVGVAVGGAVGMILFRSGKGWRTASAVTGLGVAVGSTYTRVTYKSKTK